MATGDATLLGWPLVNSSTGKVKDGANEINITRDLAAEVKIALDSRFTGKITRGTSTPLNTSGSDGDIYLKMV
jgi:hypothetical protein